MPLRTQRFGQCQRPVPTDPAGGQSPPKAQKLARLCSCNFAWAGRLSFAPVSRDSFVVGLLQDLVSCFACNPAEVEMLSTTLGIEDGNEPAVHLQLWLRPSARVRSRSSNSIGIPHSGPVKTDQKAAWRCSVSQSTCVAAHVCISCLHCRCLYCRSWPRDRSSR